MTASSPVENEVTIFRLPTLPASTSNLRTEIVQLPLAARGGILDCTAYDKHTMQRGRRGEMRKFTSDTGESRQRTIGTKLRLARQAAGLSQTKLGEGLGVSFQQVQKYERGSNRLSVDALERSCAILGISTASLLAEGPLEQAMEALIEENISDEALADEIFGLVASYSRISPPSVRRRIRDLVVYMGRAEDKI